MYVAFYQYQKHRGSLYIKLDEREQAALFGPGRKPPMRVVVKWHDPATREVALRIALPSESGGLAMYRPNKEPNSKDLIAMVQCPPRPLFSDHVFGLMKPRNVRVEPRLGIPHLIFQMPTQAQSQKPKQRYDRDEPLYKPQQNPPSPVRHIYQAPQKVNVSAVMDRVVRMSSKTVENGTAKTIVRRPRRSTTELLRHRVRHLNAMKDSINGLEFYIDAKGEVRARVVL